jgi:hypothetical protein
VLKKDFNMSDKTSRNDEERRINIRSFYIGGVIVMAIFIFYIILYFAGLIH